METFPEDLLVVFGFRKFKENSGGGFGETKASSKIKLVTDVGRLIQT